MPHEPLSITFFKTAFSMSGLAGLTLPRSSGEPVALHAAAAAKRRRPAVSSILLEGLPEEELEHLGDASDGAQRAFAHARAHVDCHVIGFEECASACILTCMAPVQRLALCEQCERYAQVLVALATSACDGMRFCARTALSQGLCATACWHGRCLHALMIDGKAGYCLKFFCICQNTSESPARVLHAVCGVVTVLYAMQVLRTCLARAGLQQKL